MYRKKITRNNRQVNVLVDDNHYDDDKLSQIQNFQIESILCLFF